MPLARVLALAPWHPLPASNLALPPLPPLPPLLPPPQVLLVVDQPEREADEAAADYAKRLQSDRMLALNPNYSADA